VMTQEIIEVMERAHAALWDKHYGRGLSLEYTRAISTEINSSIAALRAQDAGDFAMMLLRLALDLRPDFTAARLLAADILDAQRHLENALQKAGV